MKNRQDDLPTSSKIKFEYSDEDEDEDEEIEEEESASEDVSLNNIQIELFDMLLIFQWRIM